MRRKKMEKPGELEKTGLKAEWVKIINSIPGGVSIAPDPTCKTIIHNPSVAKFLRIEDWASFSLSDGKPTKLKIYRDGKLLKAEDMPIQRAAWYGEEIAHDQLEYVWEDGVIRIGIWNTRPLRDDSGQIVGAIATFEDMTERERLLQQEIQQRLSREENLSKLNQRVNSILGTITDGFFTLDKEFKITYINKAASKMLSRVNKNLLGKSILKLFPIRNLQFEEAYKTAMYQKVPVNFEAFSFSTDMVMDMSVYPLEDGLSIFFKDISHRLKNEENLRHSEARFYQVFRFCPLPMLIIKFDNNQIVETNYAFETFTGFTREDAVGKSTLDLSLVRDLQKRTQFYAEMEATGTVKNFEIEFYTKQGESHDGLFAAELIYFNGAKHILLAFSDVTEFKRIEKEIARLDKLSIIGEMAAGLGHEVRNPMTTVRGFLQLLATKEKYQSEREFFDIMISEMDRANQIISEFLSIAQVSTAETRIVDLNGVLNNLEPLLSAQALEIEHEVKIERGLISNIMVNPKEINQLVLNLVKNGFRPCRIVG
ncbi:MAG: PAS domain S-box protein, partial [Peptococcaceae bacterium]|nr:PAS domain S-box protein [Peptococcaceae bacterium]